MADNTFSIKSGVTVLTVCAFLVAAILKLGGAINWSWWLITSPLWVTFVIVMIVVLYLSRYGK